MAGVHSTMHLSLEWFDQQMALDLDNLSPGISERIINTQKSALTQLTSESYATLPCPSLP